jgi:hypothetical protein
MLDLEELKSLASLVDNMESLSVILEKAYNDQDSEKFEGAKNRILELQKKFSNILIEK